MRWVRLKCKGAVQAARLRSHLRHGGVAVLAVDSNYVTYARIRKDHGVGTPWLDKVRSDFNISSATNTAPEGDVLKARCGLYAVGAQTLDYHQRRCNSCQSAKPTAPAPDPVRTFTAAPEAGDIVTPVPKVNKRTDTDSLPTLDLLQIVHDGAMDLADRADKAMNALKDAAKLHEAMLELERQHEEAQNALRVYVSKSPLQVDR